MTKPTMLPFHHAAKDDFESVNKLIVEQLHSDVPMIENIGHYIIDAGGKRLRPLLVLLSAKVLGYQGKNHINLAAIIEFIHTATLLHDDVVDTSNLRRGRSTANAKWGNAPSVLVGDFLYSRAFQLLAAIGNMPIMDIMSSATNIIAEGEVQQLINAGNPDVTEADYYTVIHKKTAKLFEAATHVGATIAGGSSTELDLLKQYGYHVGMAFQLLDDMLDYQGNAQQLGKNVGDDLAEGKPTLPLIYAMAHGSPADATIIQQAITNKSLDNLEQVVDIIQRSGGLEHTKQQAIKHSHDAKHVLESFPHSESLQALKDIAKFAINRDH